MDLLNVSAQCCYCRVHVLLIIAVNMLNRIQTANNNIAFDKETGKRPFSFLLEDAVT